MRSNVPPFSIAPSVATDIEMRELYRRVRAVEATTIEPDGDAPRALGTLLPLATVPVRFAVKTVQYHNGWWEGRDSSLLVFDAAAPVVILSIEASVVEPLVPETVGLFEGGLRLAVAGFAVSASRLRDSDRPYSAHDLVVTNVGRLLSGDLTLRAGFLIGTVVGAPEPDWPAEQTGSIMVRIRYVQVAKVDEQLSLDRFAGEPLLSPIAVA